MSAYIFLHTDPDASSFAVKPFTANGPATPASSLLYTNTSSGVSAVSADTSLVLVGKGVPEYGEVVQNNLIYMTEHFANQYRPNYPMQGQIWYKNEAGTDPSNPSDPAVVGLYLYTGTDWATVLTQAGSSGNLNLAGYKIINLGDPTAATDGLNLQYADARFLKLAGGTVTGSVSVSGGTFAITSGANLTVANTPTISTHAANKNYVDLQIAVVSNAVNNFAADQANYVLKAGDSMSGSLALGLNASLTLASGGTGTVDVGSRRIQSVGTPSANTDATHKLYVDTAISTAIAAIPSGGSGTADGVVSAGTLNATTGVLTLTRTESLSPVLITGIAPFVHVHDAADVTYDMTQPYSQSYFLPIAFNDPTIDYPTPAVYNMLLTLDQAIYDAQRPNHRQIIVQTTPGTTTFTFNDDMYYNVNENKLQVFVNGQKSYANERGRGTVTVTSSLLGLNTVIAGLTTGSKSFVLTVDGTPHTITITVTGSYTYADLYTDIADYLDTNSIPASVNIEQYLGVMDINFDSHSSGAGSSITVSYAAGEVFTLMTYGATPVNRSVTTTLGYAEVGIPGEESNQITFTTAPATGATIEVILFS